MTTIIRAAAATPPQRLPKSRPNGKNLDRRPSRRETEREGRGRRDLIVAADPGSW